MVAEDSKTIFGISLLLFVSSLIFLRAFIAVATEWLLTRELDMAQEVSYSLQQCSPLLRER